MLLFDKGNATSASAAAAAAAAQKPTAFAAAATTTTAAATTTTTTTTAVAPRQPPSYSHETLLAALVNRYEKYDVDASPQYKEHKHMSSTICCKWAVYFCTSVSSQKQLARLLLGVPFFTNYPQNNAILLISTQGTLVRQTTQPR